MKKDSNKAVRWAAIIFFVIVVIVVIKNWSGFINGFYSI